MNGRSGVGTASSLTRALPAALAFLLLIAGLLMTRVAAMYVPGFSCALILALAVPLTYSYLNHKAGSRGNRDRGVHWFLVLGLSIFAVISAVFSAVLLSFGSVDAAAGDFGGIYIWLVSSAGLFVLSIAAAIFWPNHAAMPEGCMQH